MSDLLENKFLMGGVIIAVIAVALYFIIGTGSPAVDNGSLSTSSPTGVEASGGAVDTSQILRRLNRLRDIELETGVFQTPAFANLIDFGVQIRQQEIGRDNPFLPSTYTPSGEVIVPNDSTAGEDVSLETLPENNTQRSAFPAASDDEDNEATSSTSSVPENGGDEQAENTEQAPPTSPDIGS